jgi:hypothetical protein
MEDFQEVKISFLRHTVAVLCYRGGKILRDAPEAFGDFRINDSSRTPVEILAHINDLFEWAMSLVRGEHVWRDSKPGDWQSETVRFYDALKKFDSYLASGAPVEYSPEKIFQGPVADALTHFGQIAMLRRLASSPVRGENYFKADILTGSIGPEQAAPVYEF